MKIIYSLLFVASLSGLYFVGYQSGRATEGNVRSQDDWVSYISNKCLLAGGSPLISGNKGVCLKTDALIDWSKLK